MGTATAKRLDKTSENYRLGQEMTEIAANRLRLIRVSDSYLGDPKKHKKNKIAFLAQLASMGYHVENPEAYDDSVLEMNPGLISVLQEMRGGNVDYVPLFQNFPDDIPDDDEHFSKRILGLIGNFFGLFESGRELDSGMKVPEWLFDLEEFGADPITQLQDRGLYEKGVKNQKGRDTDDAVVWVNLRIEWDFDTVAQTFLKDNLRAKSSIKEALKPDIEFLLNRYANEIDIDPKDVVFKETRTYLTKFFWTRGAKATASGIRGINVAARYLDTPTDVLRLFAALTDSDVSLATPVKFPKLNRPQRQVILEVLEGCSNLAEDMLPYKGLWLSLGRFLHPGEYAKRFPKVYAAFDALRNGKVTTFNARVEKAIRHGDIPGALKLLVGRPALLARRIHHLLRLVKGKSVDQRETIVSAFSMVANQIPVKTLLVLESHLKTIDGSDRRSIINKKGCIKVMDNEPNRTAKAGRDDVLDIINDAIVNQMRAKQSWKGKKVWIDDGLSSYTVPLQQRKASDGLMTVGRGSQIPLEKGKVLRMFVWWKEAITTTDLDLSLISYDDDMEYVGHVSYTNLSSEGVAHSGDIVSAPLGVAEFIDVDIAKLKKKNDCRYLAIQVYRFAGDRFSDMDCHAGWMLRDKVDKSLKSFDIKTVQNKFNLDGNGSYSIPILVDLKENRVIFVDIYVNSVNRYNRVEGAHEDISSITREMARMIETRPNLLRLATLNALGRDATVVDDREEADLTIGVEGCDFNAGDAEKILSEFL